MTKEQMTEHSVNIIRDLKTILQYHQSSGINHYMVGEEVESFLAVRPTPPADVQIEPSPVIERSKPPATQRVQQPARQVKKQQPVVDTKKEMAAISGQVTVCENCTLSKKRVFPVPGRGGSKVRLMVVGDWLAMVEGIQMPAASLFGIEQDRMLGKMVDAIKLPRSEAFVTNVIKCGIPESIQPKAEHVQACISYLHRQIALLRPEVILSMGMIATRSLLNRREPLSRLRGRLHHYTTSDDHKIPLIATYHPTFLLQNPEMKRATWVDLQMLAKQLGTSLG